MVLILPTEMGEQELIIFRTQLLNKMEASE